MNYIEQSRAAGRHILPDLARAFALIGIVLVNVAVIAYPIMTGYDSGGIRSGLDRFAYFIVNGFFFHKAYTLFAFMFGVGFAYQMGSAKHQKSSFTGRYWRRIIGLFFFGFIHIALIFQGDILVLYALIGSILFLFRHARTKVLRTWAIALYGVQILMTGLFAVTIALGQKYAPDDMALEALEMTEKAAASLTVFGHGRFIETVSQRLIEWGDIIIFGSLLQGFGTLSFFLFGLLAVRSGIISNPDAPIWEKFRKTFLPIGIIGSLIGAWMMQISDGMMDPRSMFALLIITIFAPFSTAGYLGWIAKWAAGPMTSVKTFLARGGTASLTAYLMQGLILSFIFNNYGLGLFQQLGAAACIFIALVVGVFTVCFASIWRLKFTRGPLEYLLRKWTYLN